MDGMHDLQPLKFLEGCASPFFVVEVLVFQVIEINCVRLRVLLTVTQCYLLLPSVALVSCPDRFFLCFGWGKRVWCNSNSSFVLNPQILGIV